MEQYAPAPENAEAPKPYEYFRDELARMELYTYCRDLAEYMHETDTADIVIMDRSARPVYVGISEYWHRHYPDDPRPGFFFLNPKGFNSQESTTLDQAMDISIASLMKDERAGSPLDIRPEHEIDDEFEQAYPKLMADKDKPVVVFDTCVHTGGSLAPVVDGLERAGFKDLRLVTANAPDGRDSSSIVPDFTLNREESEYVCYPFDRDRLVEKTFEHVYSEPTRDPWALRMGTQLREEIRRVVRENDTSHE